MCVDPFFSSFDQIWPLCIPPRKLGPSGDFVINTHCCLSLNRYIFRTFIYNELIWAWTILFVSLSWKVTWSPSLEGQVRVLHMLMIENKISIAISKKLITLNFGLSMAMNCWLPKLFVSKSNRCIWTSNYVKMTLKTNGTQLFSINLERKQSVPDFHWNHR